MLRKVVCMDAAFRYISLCFFFQAEDGIRDLTVTGVQTCALPISEEDYANARRYLGLDRPYVEQYLSFVGKAVTGDLGTSIRARRPVMELIKERLPNSLRLALFAMGVSLAMAFPLGVMAAVKKGSAIDRTAQVISVLGQSLPTFWVAIVLVEFVAGRLQWLPAGGIEGFASYVLPGFTLGWFVVAGIMRLLRSGMLEVLDSEYVKLARLKGVAERKVVWVHALKNALIPVVTFAGIYFAILVTTAIVVETVFAWPRSEERRVGKECRSRWS